MNGRHLSQLRRVLPYLGAAFIVWLLLRQVSPRFIWELLRRADPAWLCLGVGWYMTTILFRCCRFAVLLDRRGWLQPLVLLPDMLALSLINNLFPARAGEISFPVILKRRHDIPIGEGLILLFIARFFDFLAVLCLFIVIALLNEDASELTAGNVLVPLSLLLIPLVLLGALLPWLGQAGLSMIRWMMHRSGQVRRPLSSRLLSAGEGLVETVGRTHSLHTYSRVFGWSLAGWLTTFAWFTAFLRAIDVDTQFPMVIIGATFAVITKALPLITVGGFGAHEAGWAFGFHLTGMSADLAIASGFAVNILTLLSSILIGLFVFGSSVVLGSDMLHSYLQRSHIDSVREGAHRPPVSR